MKHDFREVKAAVMETVKDMDAKDLNWKWKAVVQKAQIKILWSYLEYKGEIPPFIITDGTVEKEEVSGDGEEFIVLRDEHEEYLSGRIVGKGYFGDGDLQQCVMSLMKQLQQIANNRY